MLKNKNIILIVLTIVAVVAVPFASAILDNVEVSGISKACQNSEACREAVAKEEEANKNAASAASSADYYQMKVSELSVEIASREAEIVQTEVEIKELKEQIYETQLKLEEEQEALAELLVNKHFESDAEPIRILAGSTSISDLAEKAAREEVAKNQISSMAESIKDDKNKLEEDKAQVESLLEEQQKAKKDLEIEIKRK